MNSYLNIVRYNFPTTIFAGPGARHKLADLLIAQHIRQPLIVTDRGVAQLPMLAEMRAELQARGVMPQVYSEIFGNPTVAQAMHGATTYKERRCDGIVALGGGAALDVAKVIALMAHHPGSALDYEDGRPDARPIDQPIPYIVALPTTAGTGSEVGRSAVVSDDTTHVKKIIFSPRLLAPVVLADPELTLALPAAITASTGMDALTHLMEAYLAKDLNPMCDGIALAGLQLVHESLAACVQHAQQKSGATPEHLIARGMMLNAALMGAAAFQKGLGVTHSCAHALSTVCDLHHGLANGIMLPYAMAFNMKAVPDRFATMARVMNLRAPTGEAVLAWIDDLQQQINIPKHLTAVGVTRAHVPELVRIAVQDGCHQNNPCPVDAKDIEQLFQHAMG